MAGHTVSDFLNKLEYPFKMSKKTPADDDDDTER